MPRKRSNGVPKKQTTSGGLKTGKPTTKEKALPVLDTKTPFPIVGIGASAGGLEPFGQFFTGIQTIFGPSFSMLLSIRYAVQRFDVSGDWQRKGDDARKRRPQR